MILAYTTITVGIAGKKYKILKFKRMEAKQPI